MRRGPEEQQGQRSRFAEEELRLREETLSRTPSSVDEERREISSVLVPMSGGMVSAESEEGTRVEVPSGEGIDRKTLSLRDATLSKTPSDSDPRRRKVEQITSPEQGGMR